MSQNLDICTICEYHTNTDGEYNACVGRSMQSWGVYNDEDWLKCMQAYTGKEDPGMKPAKMWNREKSLFPAIYRELGDISASLDQCMKDCDNCPYCQRNCVVDSGALIEPYLYQSEQEVEPFYGVNRALIALFVIAILLILLYLVYKIVSKCTAADTMDRTLHAVVGVTNSLPYVLGSAILSPCARQAMAS